MPEVLGLHITWESVDEARLFRNACPDCGRWSAFVALFQEYYGWDVTCLLCGRSWIDGEWQPLPFQRFARRDSIAAARRAWRRAPNRKLSRSPMPEPSPAPTS